MSKLSLEKKHKSLKICKQKWTEKSYSEDMKNTIPEFTLEELQAAIDILKKRKVSDNIGIRTGTSRFAT